MTALPLWFALVPAALIGVGLYGIIVHPQPLRKLVSFNVVGSGAFLLFGAVARRGAAVPLNGDPVPQALLITGIVVAFCASALAVMLILQLHDRSGDTSLEPAGEA
ncbi:MAG TPA: NADH-quinone oxidoreductase subunit K [Casimicrobiaceae bacterium]|nr:NADH-quinone oxidoreductase subunit K [Casimicrobiaceae bacterium]